MSIQSIREFMTKNYMPPQGFTPYKGRSIERGQFVKVYRNLHKGNPKKGEPPVYSIKSMVDGKVLGHAESVELHNAIFNVSEAGRQKVLKEQKKNVHAFVIGAYNGAGEARRHEAYYNPYQTETFVRRNVSGAFIGPIHSASIVHLGAEGITYTGR